VLLGLRENGRANGRFGVDAPLRLQFSDGALPQNPRITRNTHPQNSPSLTPAQPDEYGRTTQVDLPQLDLTVKKANGLGRYRRLAWIKIASHTVTVLVHVHC